MDKRRASVLREMGVTRWVARGSREAVTAEAVPVEPVRQPETRIAHEPPAAEPSASARDAMAEARAALQGESRRSSARPSPQPVQEDTPPQTIPAEPVAADSWEALRQRVATCTNCRLHETRTNAVFGVGDVQADWMVIGEAPGQEEDRRGEPFVGRAGQLLDAMLLAAGFPREQVFIANILKCRPPNNRDPRPDEAAACSGYLKKQVEWVAPKIILAVGRISAQNLLGSDAPIGKLRGRVHTHPDTGTPVVVTYHPAYLLRQPGEKRKAWEDLKLALRVASGEAA
ncbi:MAG: uracil-DNA glycosylase family protein [Gammaproteobacteria bacterium]|nr:uracil-DNA glycosylase family protein [Gammaproteobacteria bacterium]